MRRTFLFLVGASSAAAIGACASYLLTILLFLTAGDEATDAIARGRSLHGLWNLANGASVMGGSLGLAVFLFSKTR